MRLSQNNNCLSLCVKTVEFSVPTGHLEQGFTWSLSVYFCIPVLSRRAGTCALVVAKSVYVCVCVCAVRGCVSAEYWRPTLPTLSLSTMADPETRRNPRIRTPTRAPHRRGQTANPKHAFSITPTGWLPWQQPHQLVQALHACSVPAWPLQSVKPFLKGKQIEKCSEEV